MRFSGSVTVHLRMQLRAKSLNDPMVANAVFRLNETPERTKPFIELAESFGPALIEEIVAAYRQH